MSEWRQIVTAKSTARQRHDHEKPRVWHSRKARPRSRDSAQHSWEAKIWPTHGRETDCRRTDVVERQSAECRVRHSQELTKNRSRYSRAMVERYGRARTKMWPRDNRPNTRRRTDRERRRNGRRMWKNPRRKRKSRRKKREMARRWKR